MPQNGACAVALAAAMALAMVYVVVQWGNKYGLPVLRFFLECFGSFRFAKCLRRALPLSQPGLFTGMFNELEQAGIKFHEQTHGLKTLALNIGSV